MNHPRRRESSPGIDAAVALDRYRYLSLATYRKNGTEVATPVWFSVVDGTLYVFTAGDSGKVKRVRRSSRARVAPCDARGHVHGMWRDASARLISDPALIASAHAALRRKYRWQKWVLDLFSRLSGRIHRRAWLAIEII